MWSVFRKRIRPDVRQLQTAGISADTSRQAHKSFAPRLAPDDEIGLLAEVRQKDNL